MKKVSRATSRSNFKVSAPSAPSFDAYIKQVTKTAAKLKSGELLKIGNERLLVLDASVVFKDGQSQLMVPKLPEKLERDLVLKIAGTKEIFILKKEDFLASIIK